MDASCVDGRSYALSFFRKTPLGCVIIGSDKAFAAGADIRG
jgi:hypothetical protein